MVSYFGTVSNMRPVYLNKWYYLTYSKEDKEVHTFPKGISTKVNVIAWLEFKLNAMSQSNTLALRP